MPRNCLATWISWRAGGRPRVLQMQRNWIGRSEGVEIRFDLGRDGKNR